MNEKPLTDENATLGALLRRPYELMSEWLYGELARRGFDDVRPAYSAVLRNLSPGGARVSALAARAGMTKQSMGYLVGQMEGAKLVDVLADPDDRRASVVRLTARGVKVVALAIDLSKRYEAHVASLIGDRKMTQLRTTLLEVYAALDEAPVP